MKPLQIAPGYWLVLLADAQLALQKRTKSFGRSKVQWCAVNELDVYDSVRSNCLMHKTFFDPAEFPTWQSVLARHGVEWEKTDHVAIEQAVNTEKVLRSLRAPKEPI